MIFRFSIIYFLMVTICVAKNFVPGVVLSSKSYIIEVFYSFEVMSLEGLKKKILDYGKREKEIGDALVAQEENCRDVIIIHKVGCLKAGKQRVVEIFEKKKLSVLWSNSNWEIETTEIPCYKIGEMIAFKEEVDLKSSECKKITIERLNFFKQNYSKNGYDVEFKKALKLLKAMQKGKK